MCEPEIAARNMEYIGYTSGVSGDKAFSIEYYDEDTEEPVETEYSGIFDWMVQTYELETEETDGYEAWDLGYFFGDGKVVYTDVVGRQFTAQYPDGKTTERCVVMNYFDDEANARINTMWENVKGVSFPIWAIVLIVVGVLLVVGAALLIRFKDKIFKGGKGKKGVKVVSKEEI